MHLAGHGARCRFWAGRGAAGTVGGGRSPAGGRPRPTFRPPGGSARLHWDGRRRFESPLHAAGPSLGGLLLTPTPPLRAHAEPHAPAGLVGVHPLVFHSERSSRFSLPGMAARHGGQKTGLAAWGPSSGRAPKSDHSRAPPATRKAMGRRPPVWARSRGCRPGRTKLRPRRPDPPARPAPGPSPGRRGRPPETPRSGRWRPP